jgi:hypothetical protein
MEYKVTYIVYIKFNVLYNLRDLKHIYICMHFILNTVRRVFSG